MFTLNPLNLPDAQLQHMIMLVVAAVLGFIIGYIAKQQTARQLSQELARLNLAVDACYQATATPVTNVARSEEDTTLHRIAARAGEINFGRIGTATLAEADDLKDIVGVGPYLEKKLHAIGIYTFRQIANFTDEDVDKVNDVIEFFPGRIQRDNWVGQAAEFANRK